MKSIHKEQLSDSITLYRGDCLEVMAGMEPGCVDAVITDPPYGTTACKWDSVIPLEDMWIALNRIKAERAAVALTCSQPFTAALIMSNVKRFKYCWVWHKKTSANVALAKYQPLKAHEDVAIFGANYYPQMVNGKYRMKGGKVNCGEASGGMDGITNWNDTYYPTSVIDMPPERGFHPTQKPVALMEYLARTYSKEADTVLDFTMGSGTTGVACVKLGRNFIGIEQNKEYFDIACKRISDELKRERFALPLKTKGKQSKLL